MKRILLLLTLSVISYSFGKTQDNNAIMDSIYALSIEDLMNTKVTIATKSEQSVNETPSVVSVITAEEIKNMGARELEDIMQIIPGFELTKRYTGEYGVGVRGLKDSRTTSKVLIMLDGNPYNQIFYGNSFGSGYDFDLNTIEKVEIIRGPGSALYGRNAFSGVINIITKRANKNEKSGVNASIGNFNERAISGIVNLNSGDLSTSISARRIFNGITNSKSIDDFGNKASWNVYANNTNISANIDFKNFKLSASFFDINNGGFLTNTFVHSRKGYYSIGYNSKVKKAISFNASIYGHNGFYLEDIEQLRPNFIPIYPNGIYYRPEVKEFLFGIESSIKYKISSNNDLLVGFQSDLHGVSDVNIYSNYYFANDSMIPGIGRGNAPLYKPGWFVNNGHNYSNLAFYAQDIWYPISNLGITLGGRYDIESQIGPQFNPRIGIVYEPVKNMNVKLLYGRAYRAPSPNEQYQTLGYVYGNQDLKPEVMTTFEIALNYRYNKLSNSISFFRNQVSDIIYALANNTVDPGNKTNNIGKNTSLGIEYECKTVISKSVYAFLNYSYTFSVNSNSLLGIDTSYNHADVAPHKINFGVNYKIHKVNFNISSFYRSKMAKYYVGNQPVQDKMGNFIVLNSTIRYDNIISKLYSSLSIYNILDTKYYSQDNEHLKQPAQPGRQIILSLGYLF
jgi:outer membrane receptor for ferrienterochelin and colicins